MTTYQDKANEYFYTHMVTKETVNVIEAFCMWLDTHDQKACEQCKIVDELIRQVNLNTKKLNNL
jgi:hypothetical protein